MDQRLLAGTEIKLETLLTQSSPRANFWHRARVWVARKLVSHIGWSTPWALGPVKPLLIHALRTPADLTIVHTEAPFWVGGELLKMGRCVAADFEDWYSEDLLPSAQKARPLALIRRIEKQLLHSAAFCTTTSTSMAKALAHTYDAPVPAVIPNCFPLHCSPAKRPTRTPELVWYSQTTGPGRGLEEFITLWGKLPPTCGCLTLIGSLVPGYDNALRQLLPGSAFHRLKFHEPVPPDELPLTLTRFDVGLALEHRTPPNKDLTISNKIFQYLNAGLAIIATPTKGQMEVMHHAPQAGVVVDFESTDTSHILEEFLANSGRIKNGQMASRQAAENHYHWEKFSPRLLELLETVTRNHG